jgi:Holliday junction DNA helicase RuvB P-loop domain
MVFTRRMRVMWIVARHGNARVFVGRDIRTRHETAKERPMAEEQPDGEARTEVGSNETGSSGADNNESGTNKNRPTDAAHPTKSPEATSPRARSGPPSAAQGRRREIDFAVPTLRHFASFSRVTQFAEGYVVEALREGRALDHMLVHGRPGSGTTTLARAIVRDYAPERSEELDAQLGVSMPRLVAALRKINRRGVLVIRHVELLDPPCAHLLAGYLEGKRIARRVGPDAGGTPMPPWASDIDRAISRSARDDLREGSRETTDGDDPSDRDALVPGGTVIATALLPGRLSYRLRNAFKQQLHLRNDPKALRIALSRVLRRAGIELERASGARVERVLSSLADATEPLARTIIARAGLEGRDLIDDELMRSIIEEDLAARLTDTQYAASLREHLAGRKVREASEEEVSRIDRETGWGRTASQAAIATMIRERQARKRKEAVTLPI